MTIIDPYAKDPVNLIQVFWDSERAAQYLTWLRSTYKVSA